MKEFWLKNWETILGSTVIAALIAGVATIIVALIAKEKKKKPAAKPQPKKKNRNLPYRQAEVFEEHNDYRKALEHYLQAAEEYKDDTLDQAMAFNAAGTMCHRLAQYDDAIDFYLQAQAIYVDDPKANQLALARIYNNLAIVYRNQGKYTKECVDNMRIDYELSGATQPFTDWLAAHLNS